jgi:hypothetical protein
MLESAVGVYEKLLELILKEPREAPAGIAIRREVTCKQIGNYKSSLFLNLQEKKSIVFIMCVQG